MMFAGGKEPANPCEGKGSVVSWTCLLICIVAESVNCIRADQPSAFNLPAHLVVTTSRELSKVNVL
jgi:hypothetical protein